MKDYSQEGEQPYILEYFGDHLGHFLEIGAYDGVSYSNTYALALRGWSGVAYEPGVIYDKLVHNTAGLNIQCIRKGLGVHDGTVSWWDDGGGALGTTSLEHKTKWEKAGAVFTPCEMEVVSWDTLFAQHGTGFDMISLDVEGDNLRLLLALPLASLEYTSLVVVEHDNQCEYMWTYLEKAGFSVLANTGLNLIMAKGKRYG